MTSRTALPSNPFRAPERSLPAQTRLDEFEIERVLAQSSFAVVYRAYDHALKLHVAIKEYLPDALALRSAETQVVLRARSHAERFELGLQAFIDEAQTLARCEHPSLLHIARILQRHGTAYRVMRYSPGPTLLAHRRELAATPDARAMRAWLDALLGALEALHEEGCVHAAVAPGNILLLPGGRPMLLDFDAVRTALISDRTQSMMAALEPCFEPVEQRAPTGDMAVGPWTDLYALAATLHFCIGGQLPAAPAGTGFGQVLEPLGQIWQQLSVTQPGLGEAPPWLSALDSCLCELPMQRPQSVAQLKSLLDGPAASAPPGRAQPSAPELPLFGLDRPAKASAPMPLRPDPAPPHIAGPLPGRPAAASAPEPSQTPTAQRAVQARASAAKDASHAQVIADLDKTFAFIAAQANQEATSKAADAGAQSTGADAALSDADRPAMQGTRGAMSLTRPQWWMAAATALVMLLALAAGVAWLLDESRPELVGGTATDARQSPAAPVWATATGGGASGDGLPDAAPPAAGPAARSGSPAAASPKADARPPTGTKPRSTPAPTSPREACGERTRFALYQCMQTQCAKSAWSKHAQCVRLRKEQRLN